MNNLSLEKRVEALEAWAWKQAIEQQNRWAILRKGAEISERILNDEITELQAGAEMAELRKECGID